MDQAWQQLGVAPARRSPLQAVSATHVGVLLIVAMIALVVTSGPTAMKTSPQRLPALVSGSGSGSGNSSSVATEVLPARDSEPVRRMLDVGTAQLDPKIRAGGIPSPAAAALLAVDGGGGRLEANTTGTSQMAGIPSPAAAEKLGPAELPFHPDDGVTLPRNLGERDSHAFDSHYGAGTLAMEEPALPAMTPGAAAMQAEHQVIRNELSGGDARVVSRDGTYAVAL